MSSVSQILFVIEMSLRPQTSFAQALQQARERIQKMEAASHVSDGESQQRLESVRQAEERVRLRFRRGDVNFGV